MDPARPSADRPDGPLLAGRYQLHELIGRGGAGEVHRATDTRLDRAVAVKSVRLPPGLGAEEIAETRDRTLREARAAGRLQHPGAVAMYDVVEQDGVLHLVMELVDGPSLAARTAAEGPLPPGDVARIGLQLVGVLQAAHDAGLVHRDVKPSNVLLQDDLRARLSDFGTAVVVGGDRLTATGVVIGSPAYMSPEQARGEDLGPATDLWSLGATLYAAVEGVPPFRGDTPLATMGAVVHGTPRPAERAGRLQEVLDRLLVSDPAQRADAQEARSLLRAIVEGRPRPTEPVPVTVPERGFGPARRGGGRSRLAVAGAAVLLVAAAALGFSALRGADGSGDLTAAGEGADDAASAGAAPGASPSAGGDDAAAGVPASPTAAEEGVSTEGPGAEGDPAAADPDSAGAGGGGADEDGAGDEGDEGGSDADDADDADADEGEDAGRGAGGGQGQGGGPPATPPGQAGGGPAGGSGGGAGGGAGGSAGDEAGAGGGELVPAAEVPADWVAYDPDHAPYALRRPPGWQVERLDATRTDLRDPGSPTYLRLDWTDDPAEDPLADWQAYEPRFAAGREGYERIRMEGGTFRGHPAALWEYRYTAGGVTYRAYNLNGTDGTYGYALNLQTTEDRWADVQETFRALAGSYDIEGG